MEVSIPNAVNQDVKGVDDEEGDGEKKKQAAHESTEEKGQKTESGDEQAKQAKADEKKEDDPKKDDSVDEEEDAAEACDADLSALPFSQSLPPPFVLRRVGREGLACGVCPWMKMCPGKRVRERDPSLRLSRFIHYTFIALPAHTHIPRGDAHTPHTRT